MSDQDQGQLIDPSKMIAGRRVMTQSHRKERKKHTYTEEGKGRRWFRDFLGYTVWRVTVGWPDPGGVPELSGSGTPRCHWWWVWPITYTKPSYTRPWWHCSKDCPNDVTFAASLSWRTGKYISAALLCQPFGIFALV